MLHKDRPYLTGYHYYVVVNGTELVLSNKRHDLYEKYGRYNKLYYRVPKRDIEVVLSPTDVHYLEPLYRYQFKKVGGQGKGRVLSFPSLCEAARALWFKKHRFQSCVLGEIPRVSGWAFVPEHSYVDYDTLF